MMRIGLIRNPNSQRNRRIGDRLGEVVVPRQVELLRIDAATADDVPAVVREYGARGVTHLIVDGGDGTLREAMTALPPAFGTRLPMLSLVAGGNANLATSDVGGAGHGPQALQRLLDALASGQRGHVAERQPIELRWPDGSRPPVLGFFVGAAAFYKGWKLALGAVHDRGFMHGPAVAATMAGALWQTLAGGPHSDWQAGTMMGIAVDGAPEREGARFLFLATSLHSLFNGLWPFYDHGDSPLRWLDIDAPPPRFVRSLPGLLRGKPSHWMRHSHAYRSGGAQSLALRLQAPLVVDGEAYTAGPYGFVELHTGPRIAFYSPSPA
ncbi:diacylglycerol/lipid kinase family protein [Nevskia ramosa]|uniref:diacylglycerol/lipid kinase family protein n=1 Tax=Nevskia ramosa TaxID=64002 RepID=UPI00041A06E1|nr:diacylglycerol kinase family protein [Nevskia ramosa]